MPQILHLPGGVHSLDDALDTIELVEHYGSPLDEAQKIKLLGGMGVDFHGKWAATHVSDAESRQNGKGDTIQAREVGGLLVLVERMFHTAHEYPTAGQAFQRMEAFLTGHQDLRRKIKKIRYANGEQGFEMRNGAELMYRARTGGGGRGFDAVDLVVYDEAQHLRSEHMAASAPTTATSPNYQLWFAGSAGFVFSEVWWAQRLAALRAFNPDAEVPEILRRWLQWCGSVGGRFAYFEHTSEIIRINDDGEIDSTSPDPDDPLARAMANPAYGVRITPEFFDDQLRVLGPLLYLREHGGVWDPLPSADGVRREISKVAWDRQLDDNSDIVAALSFGVAVAPEAESASIGAAGLRPDDDAHVELITRQAGVRWLKPELRRLLAEWHPWCVAIDASGPGEKELVPELREVCKEFDIKLLELTTRAYAGACSGIATDVVKEHRVWHLDDAELATAVAAGTRRNYRDSWVWDQLVLEDVSPLRAVTCALRACREAPDEVSQEFMGAYV